MKEKGLKNLYMESRTVLKDVLPLDMPMCVSIEPSNLCNFKCIMCYHGNNEKAEKAKPLSNMEWSVFEKALNDIKSWVKGCGVCGSSRRIKLMKLYSLGEPLVNPKCLDMVKAIKQADIAEQLEITTNGSLMTEEISRKMVEYGLDIVRFSIYGLDDEEQKRVTGSSVSVEQIYNNISYLYKYREEQGAKKPKIFVKMFDAGEEKNAVFIDRYQSISDVAGIDEVFNMDVGNQTDVYEKFYGEEKGTLHNELMRSKKKCGRPCRYLFTHMTIRNDGTVIACCADWLKEIQFGNILSHSLQEIWESKTVYEMRKKMLQTKGQCFAACRGCEIPYRDLPEDSLDDLSIEKFDYKNKY